MLDRPRTTAEAEVKATRHVSAELTDDMTVADLIDVLEHLPFGPRGAPCTVLLDRGVFIVNCRHQRTGRPKLIIADCRSVAAPSC